MIKLSKPFYLMYNLWQFLLIIFSILSSFWLLFFIKCFNSFFTINITNSIWPWYSSFLLFWSQKFPQTNFVCSLLQKNVGILIFSHDHQFWISVFFIILNIIPNKLPDLTPAGFSLIFLWCKLMYLSTISSNLSTYTFFYTAVI